MQPDLLLPQGRAILATTPARWLALTESLPTDLLTCPPAQGHWSTAACLRHLLAVERSVFPTRVRAFLAGQDFPSFDPDAQPLVDLNRHAELARAFAALREESLALLVLIGFWMRQQVLTPTGVTADARSVGSLRHARR